MDPQDDIDPESDISAVEESSDEGEEDSDDEVDVEYVWTVTNPDIFEFPFERRPFSEQSGPQNALGRNSSPIAYFNWLSTDDNESVIDILVEETNRYAGQKIARTYEHLRPKSRLNDWENVTREEMSAFLGLWLAMGIIRKPSIESYWNETQKTWLYNTPEFSNIMRRDRFQLILQCLHANDNDLAIPRGQVHHDPAHKVRRILDLLNTNFRNKYVAARDITVDESMVGHKGRDYTVQYLPAKKSHRWGAKLWVLAESDTGFTLSMDLYAGKRNMARQNSIHGIGYDVVTSLVEPYYGKNHHIVIDNGFTSPVLCRTLTDNNTYLTGTVRDTRKGMPVSFRNMKVAKGRRVVRQSGQIMALRYGDRKTVNFLSTMYSPKLQNHRNSRGVEQEIPEVVYMYNKLMGGVDLADQQITTYDPSIKSVKLWKKLLINFLLRIVVTSYIVYLQNRGLVAKMTRLEFTCCLYQELIGDYACEKKRTGRPAVHPIPLRMTERHFIHYIPDKKRKVCSVCSSKVRTWCPDGHCSVGLCVGECFERFHTRRTVTEE